MIWIAQVKSHLSLYFNQLLTVPRNMILNNLDDARPHLKKKQ